MSANKNASSNISELKEDIYTLETTDAYKKVTSMSPSSVSVDNNGTEKHPPASALATTN